MTRITQHIRSFVRVVLLLSCVAWGVSCSMESAEDLPQKEKLIPISFSGGETEETVVTRASASLERDFTLIGYKVSEGVSQLLMDRYQVWYGANTAGTSNDNTHNYYYVDEPKGQYIKYWDFKATEYHFWAYTGEKSAFYPDGTKLSYPNLQFAASEPSVPLYSELYHRSPVTSEVVRLKFKRPYCKLRLMFYCGDEIEEGDAFLLSHITFAPSTLGSSTLASKIYSNGSLTVTYPIQCSNPSSPLCEQEHLTLSASSADRENLTFADVTIDATHGISSNTAVVAKASATSDFYYPLPMGVCDTKNPAFIMNVEMEGEPLSAVVPANFMQWKPNAMYTYIFKITEAGKKIEFYDVKIDPWMYGGSLTDEWTNW